LIFSPKLILFSLLVILSLLIGLGNHNEDIFLSNGLAQEDGTESPALDDSFSAIGTINSHTIVIEKYSWLQFQAALVVGSFVVGSQLVQPSMAQDLGEQAKEKVGRALQQLTGGNQTGNQTGNQIGNQSGGILGQLGEKVGSMLPGQ
jgi:hypothetical protein